MLNSRATSSQPLGSLGIANFKAFGPHLQKIPLRPITLVFGPNSGGKSSLLHFFLWMHEVMTQSRLDVYFPSVTGESVDLGGFKQLRHGNDPKAEIKTQIDLEIRDSQKRTQRINVTSVFASCAAPQDYATRLKAKVKERLEYSFARNALEALVRNVEALEERVIREALVSLLGAEFGEGRLLLRMRDLFEGDGQYLRPIAEIRSGASPLLNCIIKFHRRPLSVDLNDLLGPDDASIVREESPQPPAEEEPHISQDELVAELQAVACAVLEELDHKPLARAEASPALVGFEMSVSGNPILTAGRNEQGLLVLKSMDFDWLQSYHGFSPETRGELAEAFQACREGLVFDDTSTWLPGALRFLAPAERHADGSEVIEKLIAFTEGTVDLPGLLRECERAGKEELGSLSYLAPVRAIPSRHVTVSELPRTTDAPGWHAWRRLYEDEKLRSSVSEWLQKGGPQTGYAIETDHRVAWTSAMDAIKEGLALRLHHFISETEAIKEYTREYCRDVSDKDFESRNGDRAWNAEVYLDFDKMIDESLEVAFSGLKSESSGTVFLRDRRSGKVVSARDVGIGISQMIPVLVKAMDAQNETVIIEQPEIHLHPALQSELGDLFIESAMTRGNRFVLETHSEHLILRLLRRIRETTAGELPEGCTPLRPEDVAVLFIEPGENGSKVIELPITPDGDFTRPWPGGFFAERAEELF